MLRLEQWRIRRSHSLHRKISGSLRRRRNGLVFVSRLELDYRFPGHVHEQNGGSIPTITWQSTITQAIPYGPTATTTFNNIFEFDYAFDKDETRGVLPGIQDTRVEVATALARIHPNIIGYVGGYYRWPNNWKFTGRIGV